MWDWAYKNKKDWKSKMLEEEEDDEQSRRTVVDGDDDDDEDGTPSQSGGTPPSERHRKRKSGHSLTVEDDVDDEGDGDEEPGMASEIDDDEASVDAVSVARIADNASNDPDYVSEDETVRPVVAADARDVRRSRTREASAEVTDDDNGEDDVEPEPNDDPPDDEDAADGPPAGESEDDGEEGIDNSTHTLPSQSAVANAPISSTNTVIADETVDAVTTPMAMDIDVSAPAPERVSPIIAAAAASSIMAGSTLISRPSPSPSSSSAVSGSARNQSPTSSRSPTPEPTSDREADVKRGSAKTRAKPKVGRSTRNRSRRKTKVDPVLEPEAEQDPALCDVDDPDGDADEGDVDSPEMDVELDLQPAHRAEALDVLATIELKYALLRESLYVEKMEVLAWEEALVTEGLSSIRAVVNLTLYLCPTLTGIHPEMLHLHTELSKRRDKRLELASLRRDYETANVIKRRKLDEDGVWSWWKVSARVSCVFFSKLLCDAFNAVAANGYQLRRDELQTQMISETNRKRRKLDRERRALDRPQPGVYLAHATSLPCLTVSQSGVYRALLGISLWHLHYEKLLKPHRWTRLSTRSTNYQNQHLHTRS